MGDKNEIEIYGNDTVQSIETGNYNVGIDIVQQRKLALEYRRNKKNIWHSIIEELELVPEFAPKAYYSIPYKNEMGGTTYIEGPSIKAAMALARQWGNCINSTRIAEEKDDRVVVEGMFMDLETGLITTRQHSVSRGYWSKIQKRVIPLREDRLNMSIQSGMSKAVRNAILASLPISFIEAYLKKAKAIAVTNLADPKGKPVQDPRQRISVLQQKFMALGVSEDQWNEYLTGTSLETGELIAHLIGLFSSIEDGSKKLEEVFGEIKKVESEPEGQVKAGELFKKPKKI